ncbi:hypothetical protein ASPZODRAFT_90635 [Penicilliopsis zonata CBS 506.65]|uniref:Derlin n=1 Tax=Penicilliopsis zonata CBS 506.65 TaxID=1073090 RepID=A0A1L9SP13_9EURO|nr:hypothetical protein ASPZODRAFT_90635 [Penicilliopsis zonata CBS 506.65]OJJ48784.1 hypothetical protein ASPZODRAFT_90635 [Penicilliopsis zonata CBS 506.65]
MLRVLFILTFIQSTLVHVNLVPGWHSVFVSELILKFPPQIWRIFTPFVLTEPNISFIFDLYFLYFYGVALERDSSRFSAPGDFLTYVFVVGIFVLFTAGFLMKAPILLPALLVAFSYTYGQINRGRKVTFIVLPMRVEVVPWATIALAPITRSWYSALVLSTGLAAGHLYEFLTQLYPSYGSGRNYITTPALVRGLFLSSSNGTHATAPNTNRGQSTTQQPSGGWSSSFSGRWNSRGAGRRLGSG